MNRITAAKIVGYTIATVAAASSYGHQVDLLTHAQLDPLFGIIPSEWVVPSTVDLLAIIALMVRTDREATAKTKLLALIPLILAGSLSVAANVATAHTKVGVVVGVWTVLAYLLAEWFVSMMERKSADADLTPRQIGARKAAATRASRTLTPRQIAARKGAETRRQRKLDRELEAITASAGA
jgi:hypothetical protein